MVSASILPTKSPAAVPPDQLQALPLKVSGRVSSQQLAITTAVRKSHPEPAHARHNQAARQQGQGFEAAIRPQAGNIAVSIQSYAPQASGAADESSKLPKTLANPGESKQHPPAGGPWHEDNQNHARHHGQPAEQKQALSQARFRREDGLECG